ncbi:type I-E CRISPR-associated protein Cse2/CasB [Streptomyces sp. NPDC050504]|uniref:type I-E CRISPR-associated protein Cse2/CasB n=1 Tax=Streptomyces sp. NPDC050504 TaxID=3365618 RepID=UPI0037B6BFE2
MNRTTPVPDQRGSEQLAAWLGSLVRNREYGKLAELRRTKPTDTHIRAGWFAPAEPDQREVFERVAFLFGVYHQGRAVPSYGRGSLGEAARWIGDGVGRGPDNPGAQRLLARVVASRRVPWRHLQHTVTRLRACEQPPPSWVQLADDLTRWNDRKARIAYGWSVDFHRPRTQSRGGPHKPNTRKDPST